MVKSLYVGNLPWSTNEEQLASEFEKTAPIISARIVMERETGRSRGFGFVETEDEHAEKLIQAMNGAQFGGRPLVVNEARPKARR